MNNLVEKRISISAARQMTMPISFYKKYGFSNSALIIDDGEKIVIKPEPKCSGEFDDEILSDLIKKGYKNEELLSEFKRVRRQVPSAVQKLISMADDAAKNRGEYITYDEVFN